jgi:hypothetical protein
MDEEVEEEEILSFLSESMDEKDKSDELIEELSTPAKTLQNPVSSINYDSSQNKLPLIKKQGPQVKMALFKNDSHNDPLGKRIEYTAANEEDRVDKLLEEFVRNNKVKVPINRISANKYMFGMRMINASIINGVLMVRVGGGFMSMTQFVDKHSAKEILQIKVKMAKEKKKL